LRNRLYLEPAMVPAFLQRMRGPAPGLLGQQIDGRSARPARPSSISASSVRRVDKHAGARPAPRMRWRKAGTIAGSR